MLLLADYLTSCTGSKVTPYNSYVNMYIYPTNSKNPGHGNK